MSLLLKFLPASRRREGSDDAPLGPNDNAQLVTGSGDSTVKVSLAYNHVRSQPIKRFRTQCESIKYILARTFPPGIKSTQNNSPIQQYLVEIILSQKSPYHGRIGPLWYGPLRCGTHPLLYRKSAAGNSQRYSRRHRKPVPYIGSLTVTVPIPKYILF